MRQDFFFAALSFWEDLYSCYKTRQFFASGKVQQNFFDLWWQMLMMYPDSWLQERCEASGKRCSYNIISDAALLPPSSLARPCQPLKFKDAICAAVSCTAPPRTTLLIFSSWSSNNCNWWYIRVGNFCSEGNQCIFMSSSMLQVTQQFAV